jgi:PTS system mannose-specific IID component
MIRPVVRLPLRTRAAMLLRSLAIQASWNYETLVGVGVGFVIEPALRLLPGGVDGPAYRQALARQCQYFNAHPYMTAVAIGALSRAELDGEPAAKIERFRAALCGPLGASGDRLVWAGWLPLSVLCGLLAFGLGAGPGWTVLVFLGMYNVGHLALRVWGLHVGYARGLQVAQALGVSFLRQGPSWVSRAGSLLAGVAIPLAISRGLSVREPADAVLLTGVLASAALGGLGVARLQGRYELWKWSMGVLLLLVLFATVAP